MNERQLEWANNWQNKIKQIKDDIYIIKDVQDVEEVTFTVKRKKGLTYKEYTETLKSPVSVSAMLEYLEKKLDRYERFYRVVQESDFFDCKCTHHSYSSNCMENSCFGCNKTFDFFESDIDKILERAGF